MSKHPYEGLPSKAFWKKSVANRHYEEITDLWSPPEFDGTEKIATAGSCFAQHIGRHVSARGSGNYLDLEPAPPILAEDEWHKFGFGIYSCRYGNIYTSRQLVQLTKEALGLRAQSEHVWEKDGRFYDALRPTVDPVGQDSVQTVHQLRKLHLTKVRQMLLDLDVFVFTLGLTEVWISAEDGTAFPMAPGVVAGDTKSNKVEFKNLSVQDVTNDLNEFWQILRSVNPEAKMILTVSPVPLNATASGGHVLVSTSYSKSVLRVAAQAASDSCVDIYYFPSFEIVNSPQGRGYYFDPDLRNVNDRGVKYVMSHFFTGSLANVFPPVAGEIAEEDNGVVCDEERITDQ